MLLVSMLILLFVCIYSWLNICISNILNNLNIFRGNTLILAGIISSKNTYQAALRFATKALILQNLRLIHTLVL